MRQMLQRAGHGTLYMAIIAVVFAIGAASEAADDEIAGAARAMFDRLDTDRDGRLKMQEAAPDRRQIFERIFEMAGMPASGAITWEQFQDVFARHRRGRPSGRPETAPDDLVPLPELADGQYRGVRGGLYPDGANRRPETHEAAGLQRARQVQPLDGEGRAAADGTIVLLSVGMSNTGQLSEGLAKAMRQRRDINPRLRFVNGAQGGMTASLIQHADEGRGADYWRIVDDRLKGLGLTRKQVQAVWMKQADAAPQEGFPDYARRLEREQLRILEIVHSRFPNCRLMYLSSRTYGGYATTLLNPEPYAYESAFAVKWLVERQIAGDPALAFDADKVETRVPWISWGPYLWANGGTPRADGFASLREDFREDGTHHSATGADKVGQLMLDFFVADSTTSSWFLVP